MKKTRFTETQIVKAIQAHENGRDAKDFTSPQSLFAWLVCSKDSAVCLAPKLKYKIAA